MKKLFFLFFAVLFVVVMTVPAFASEEIETLYVFNGTSLPLPDFVDIELMNVHAEESDIYISIGKQSNGNYIMFFGEAPLSYSGFVSKPEGLICGVVTYKPGYGWGEVSYLGPEPSAYMTTRFIWVNYDLYSPANPDVPYMSFAPVEVYDPFSVPKFMNNVGQIFTSAVSWVGDVGAAILAQPLLLAFTALPLCGLGIAVFRRLKETV